MVRTNNGLRHEGAEREEYFPFRGDEGLVQDTSDTIQMFVSPGITRAAPTDLAQSKIGYAVVETVHPRPINVAVVLILRPSDEVEVAADNQGQVAGFNRKGKFPQELEPVSVVSWSIDYKEGPLGIVV
jgi:hypothetical protein